METYILLKKRREAPRKFLEYLGTKMSSLRGKRDILEHAARSAARKKLGILHDFQRFLAPKETYMAFEKLEFWARKGTYIKSRFWILKGGFFSVLHGNVFT